MEYKRVFEQIESTTKILAINNKQNINKFFRKPLKSTTRLKI